MASYSYSYTLSGYELYSTAKTADLTDHLIEVSITTSGATMCLFQYSSDNGATWTDHADGVFAVNTTTDVRSITIPTGRLRITLADESGSSNAVTISVTTTAADSTATINPEDVYFTAGISESVVSRANCWRAIVRAESEVRQLTGLPMTTESVSEEYYGNNKKSLFLDNYPIVSITSLTVGGTSVTTSYIDIVNETGKITLTNSAEAAKFTLPSSESPEQEDRNVAVTYVWGNSTSPYWLKRLAECIAGIMILTTQTGGTYDDLTSYSLGDLTASLGEPYTNIRQTVMYLREEIDRIMSNVKKNVAVF